MLGSTLPGRPVLSRDFLVLDRIRFGYREREILKDVSLRFRRGQVVALIGGSGSGKTTILRLIGGQLRPQSDVHALDRDALFALRRKMGMLYQFGALFTDLNAFENVAFPLREHTDLPESMIRDLVLMKLEAVGLRGAAQFGISQLSGGMARRVALARAIAFDPPLIMYDEPFTGLDPVAIATVANLIRKLVDALDCASIVVSHDIKDAFAIADYVYLLADGRIAAEGTPDQMRDSTDPNVRQFLDGDIDGPIAFHYQAPPLAEDLGLRK
jgi:phospholipid/cholesterol/gamma-HCH transport system ATP-binding protein